MHNEGKREDGQEGGNEDERSPCEETGSATLLQSSCGVGCCICMLALLGLGQHAVERSPLSCELLRQRYCGIEPSQRGEGGFVQIAIY